ncbi:uncharacterized protein LOC130649428 isoform X2 [Hydractinia symbiolongicarpus]|uniref:uncharacterized protein LOC130649428 isoform X2 n=1 Tax=Hydractinia symbiolongicarpus TaxID=13093 RepID=UPI00254C79D2|nr:uncharacterized protein LOC130649428 isoform X2 [Hydractinia symbiolongicarpus]
MVTAKVTLTDEERPEKLNTLIQKASDHLREYLHDPQYGDLPKDRSALYNALLNSKEKLTKCLKEDQLALVYPPSEETDSKDFDITLLAAILRNCCPKIKKPKGGWSIKTPKDDDHSVAADIIRLRELRNKVKHCGSVSSQKFEDLWNKIQKVLVRLNFDVSKLNDLKQGSLELFKNMNITMNERLNESNEAVTKLEDACKAIRKSNENIKADFQVIEEKVELIKRDSESSISEVTKRIENLESTLKIFPGDVFTDDKSAVAGYNVFINNNGNVIVQIESVDKITSVKMSLEESLFELLTEEDDYKIIREDATVSLEFNKIQIDTARVISIAMIDQEGEEKILDINDIETSCLHCHVNNAQDYTVFSHGANKISEDIKPILTKQFVNSDVEYVIAGKLHSETPQQWQNHAFQYAQEYLFAGNTFLSEAVLLPPLNPANEISKHAQHIKSALILESRKYKKFGILTNYDNVEHLKFLKGPSLKHFNNHNKRMLLLHPRSNVVCNIRITPSTKFVNILNEFKCGAKDVEYLIVLVRILFPKLVFNVINVVAAPEFVVHKEDRACHDCQSFLMGKEAFSTKKNTSQFIISLIDQCQEKNENSQDVNEKNSFLKLFSQIVAFMATRKCNKQHLPSLSQRLPERMDSVLLTGEQLRILHNPASKKIILGNFGTGKTQLGLSHLEMLANNADTDDRVYYITWESKMLLDSVKKYVSTVSTLAKNRNIVATSMLELSRQFFTNRVPKLSRLWQRLSKEHPDSNVHMIVDEYDGEQLSDSEAEKLRTMAGKKRFLLSTIILLPHAIAKHRTLVSRNDKKPHKKYEYNKTGMEVFTLSKCMRTTCSNFEFIQHAESVFFKEKVTIRHPSFNLDIKSEIQEANAEDEILRVDTDQEFQDEGYIDENRYVSDTEETDDVGDGTMENSDQEDDRNANEAGLPSLIDIDIAAANMDMETIQCNEDLKTETIFKCEAVNTVGHGITGNKPILIYSDQDSNDISEQLTMLCIALNENYSFHKKENLRVIYNSVTQRKLFEVILSVLEVSYVVYNLKEDDNCEFNTVLATAQDSRGDDCENVLVGVNTTDQKLLHPTLEAMTRATCQLIFIDFSGTEKDKKNSEGNALAKFKKNQRNLLKVVCVAEKADRYDEEEYMPGPTQDNVTYDKVNTACQRYKELKKEVKKQLENIDLYEENKSDWNAIRRNSNKC